IGEVIDKVFKEEAAAMGHGDMCIDTTALQALMHHAWPGNIRQLRHAMRYACAISDGGAVRVEHFPPDLFTGPLPEAAPVRDAGPRPTFLAPFARVAREPVEPLSLSDTEAALRAAMIETLRRNHWQVK